MTRDQHLDIIAMIIAAVGIGLCGGIGIGSHIKQCPPAETYNYSLPDGTRAEIRCDQGAACESVVISPTHPSDPEVDFYINTIPSIGTHTSATECRALAVRHDTGELWVSDDGGVCVLYGKRVSQ